MKLNKPKSAKTKTNGTKQMKKKTKINGTKQKEWK